MFLIAIATLINHRTKNSSFIFPKHVCSELKIQPCRAVLHRLLSFPDTEPGSAWSGNYSCRSPVLHLFFLAFFFLAAESLITSQRYKYTRFCASPAHSALGARDFTATRWWLWQSLGLEGRLKMHRYWVQKKLVVARADDSSPSETLVALEDLR